MSIHLMCAACQQSLDVCACQRTYNASPFMVLTAAHIAAIRQIVAEEIRKELGAQALAAQMAYRGAIEDMS